MNLQERADLYHKAFPKFPPLLVWNNRIEGRIFFMGNNYSTGTQLYGAYPHGYRDRVSSMFPGIAPCDTLHLFSGSLPAGDYFRVDSKPRVDVADPRFILCDAEKLGLFFPPNRFQIIYADPPYSAEDCEHYGTIMVQRQKVFKACCAVLKPGGFLVWLDQVFPNYRKIETPMVGTLYCREEFQEMPQVGEIGIIKSTNHRVRAVFIFQKVESVK